MISTLLSPKRGFQSRQLDVAKHGARPLCPYIVDDVSALSTLPDPQPDVVILVTGCRSTPPCKALNVVLSRFPQVPVLVVSASPEEAGPLEFLEAGASGFVPISTSTAELLQALRDLSNGGAMVDPKVARRLIQQCIGGSTDGQPREQQVLSVRLTPRELEVLELAAKGGTNPKIAKRLGLSRATVRTHLEHAYQRLEVSNRAEAVARAISLGLIVG